MNESNQEPVPKVVECRAARDPSVRKFILAAMLIGFGAWCYYESYVVVGKYTRTGGLNDTVNYYFNHVGGIVLPLAGLIPLVLGVAGLRRKLIADQEGIGYVGDEKIPWRAVQSLDTAKLPKGILYLHYDTGQGRESLLLDRWKLQNFRQLVMLLEEKVVKRAGAPGGDR